MALTSQHRVLKVQRHQMGFTLVELGIALALIAALLLGGFTLVSKIKKDALMMDFSKNVTRVMSTATKYMANYRATSGITLDDFVTFGGWDRSMLYEVDSGTRRQGIKSKIPGAWEDIGYASAAFNQLAGGETIVYRVNNVPKDRCMDVISEMAKYPSVYAVYADAYTGIAGGGPLIVTSATMSSVATGTLGSYNTARNSTSYSMNYNNIKIKCANDKTWIMAVIGRD